MYEVANERYTEHGGDTEKALVTVKKTFSLHSKQHLNKSLKIYVTFIPDF